VPHVPPALEKGAVTATVIPVRLAPPVLCSVRSLRRAGPGDHHVAERQRSAGHTDNRNRGHCELDCAEIDRAVGLPRSFEEVIGRRGRVGRAGVRRRDVVDGRRTRCQRVVTERDVGRGIHQGQRTPADVDPVVAFVHGCTRRQVEDGNRHVSFVRARRHLVPGSRTSFRWNLGAVAVLLGNARGEAGRVGSERSSGSARILREVGTSAQHRGLRLEGEGRRGSIKPADLGVSVAPPNLGEITSGRIRLNHLPNKDGPMKGWAQAGLRTVLSGRWPACWPGAICRGRG
jgi:hypothetical protein